MGSSRRAQSAPRRAGHCCAAIGAVRSRATDGVIRANEKTDAFQPAFRPIESSRLRYRDGLTSIRRFIARDKCPLDVDAEKCGILGLDTLLATVTDTASDASAAQRLQSFPLPFEHGRLALGKLGGGAVLIAGRPAPDRPTQPRHVVSAALSDDDLHDFQVADCEP